MSTRDPVIEAYLETDAEKRLHLFMDCPSLRNEFIEIDLREYRAAIGSKQRRGAAPKGSLLSRWLTAMANCCLRSTKA